jgi:hypothetical protein
MLQTGAMTRIFLIAFIGGLVVPAAADEPMEITSDTPFYCIHLAQQLDAKAGLTAEARRLSADGRRMCESGHVVRGLARLRRAMMMERSKD